MLKQDFGKCLEENDLLKDSIESEQLLNQQLSAQNQHLSSQLHTLKAEEKESSTLKALRAQVAELKME